MLRHPEIPKIIRAGLSVTLLASGLGFAADAPAKISWMAYKSNLLNLSVSVPADWKPAKMPNALAFRYEDMTGAAAAIGILKSSESSTIDEAADKEFEREGRPTDWSRTPAKVDGLRAIKIVGMDQKNSGRRIVHYYIETPAGAYIVQCQAPADRWDTFSPIFTAILTKLHFIQTTAP